MLTSTVEYSASIRIMELTLLAMSVGVIAYALRIAQDIVLQVVGQIRGARGLCPHCAYDLRGDRSGICPECGTTIDEVHCVKRRPLQS
jgi:hypothetical protein